MTDLEALVIAGYVFADDYRVPVRCGLPAARPFPRPAPLRLREVTAPLRVWRPAGLADRPARAAARLHDRPGKREGVRAARRPADRHPEPGRGRRQRPLGPRLPGAAR